MRKYSCISISLSFWNTSCFKSILWRLTCQFGRIHISQFLQLRRPKVRRHKIGPMSSSAFLLPPFNTVDGLNMDLGQGGQALHYWFDPSSCQIYMTHFAWLFLISDSRSDKVEGIQICTNWQQHLVKAVNVHSLQINLAYFHINPYHCSSWHQSSLQKRNVSISSLNVTGLEMYTRNFVVVAVLPGICH